MQPRHAVPDEVCARAIAGDPEAREALVRALGPRVLAICRRMSSHPEDAFQAVWERVFTSLGRFDPEGPAKLGTWVSTVAHRHLVDEYRRRHRRGAVVSLAEVPSRSPTADQALLDAERQRALEAAIDQLPAHLRRLVVSHHIGGVPLADLAADEGVPLGTIKSRLHAARAQMLETLRRRT